MYRSGKMDDPPGHFWVLVLLVLIFIGLGQVEERITEKLDHIIELLEAEPETVVLPPMSGPEDERQNEITEGFQEDAR